jgi:uncharacterized protein
LFLRSARPDPQLLALFEESGRNVQRASLLLRELLADYPEQAALAGDVLVCEREGDRIVHDILSRLAAGGSRATHLDSADVHALAGALDDVVHHPEEAADQLGLYGVEAPMEQAEQLADVLVQCSEQVAIALRGLATTRSSARTWWPSTDSRTRPTGSYGPRSPRCSPTGSTR